MGKIEEVLGQLASTQGLRDEAPNIALAEAIAKDSDKESIKILIDALAQKDRGIQSDAIKVLYEIGERNPSLIADHLGVFLNLLTHKNNRLQWGAMTAIRCIATIQAEAVYMQLPKLLAATETGSVITRDQVVMTLIHLATLPEYHADTISLLLEQLQACPTNQLPMYAERALPVIEELDKANFTKVLEARLDEIEKDSKRKRVEKVLKKL